MEIEEVAYTVYRRLHIETRIYMPRELALKIARDINCLLFDCRTCGKTISQTMYCYSQKVGMTP